MFGYPTIKSLCTYTIPTNKQTTLKATLLDIKRIINAIGISGISKPLTGKARSELNNQRSKWHTCGLQVLT
jgi:hypothetical protein